MNRILKTALAASLFSTFTLPVRSEAVSGARPRTETALICWLGIGPRRCGQNDGCNGGDGPIERVVYLGTNVAGADIYAVRYMHKEAAYVAAPDPNGLRDQYLIRDTDHFWIKREISSRPASTVIYTRPENSPAAGCRVQLGNEGPPPP